MRLLAYGMAMMFLGLVIVMSIGPEMGDTIWIGTFWIGPIVIGTAVFCGTLVLHELVHGFAMRWYGAQPRYGVGVAAWFLPYAYATLQGIRSPSPSSPSLRSHRSSSSPRRVSC